MSRVKWDDVSALIQKVMKSLQLLASDVDVKRSVVHVHGHGLFECDLCSHRWSSHFSWITVDLREQRITYRWKMKCGYCCKSPHHGGVEPTFSIPEAEELFRKAIYWYRGAEYPRPAGTPLRRRPGRPQAPHNRYLCEKCQWGAIECWLRVNWN